MRNIILAVLLVLSLSLTGAWLDDYQYRISHIIESATGAGSNYPIEINVYWDNYFGFGTVQDINDSYASQGIATDGTYIYTTHTDKLCKYNKAGVLQTSVTTTTDGTYGRLGDLCYYDNKLYCATDNYDDTPEGAGINVYNASDLSYIGEYILSNPPDHGAGICYNDGSFWYTFNNTTSMKLWELSATDDTTFTKDAEYDLTYGITGNGGYQGIDWYGDYIFCPVHENGDSTYIDIYYWNDTLFIEHQRIKHPVFSATWGGLATVSQGLCIEGDSIWVASRGGTQSAEQDFANIQLIAKTGGNNLYVDGNSKPDFADIRFTAKDGITELDYWLENKTDSVMATFWVELSADISSVDDTIYVYWGDGTASSQSNGDSTFTYFDDFEDNLNEWTTVAGTPSIVSNPSGSGNVAELEEDDLDNMRYVFSSTITGSFANGFKLYATSNTVDYLFSYYLEEGVAGAADIVSVRNKDSEVKYYTGSWTSLSPSWNFSQNTWESIEVRVDMAEEDFYFFVDNTSHSAINGFRNSVTTGIDDVQLWTASGTGTLIIYYDDFYIRKYVSPEPAHSTWGSETAIITIDHIDGFQLDVDIDYIQ